MATSRLMASAVLIGCWFMLAIAIGGCAADARLKAYGNAADKIDKSLAPLKLIPDDQLAATRIDDVVVSPDPDGPKGNTAFEENLKTVTTSPWKVEGVAAKESENVTAAKRFLRVLCVPRPTHDDVVIALDQIDKRASEGKELATAPDDTSTTGLYTALRADLNHVAIGDKEPDTAKAKQDADKASARCVALAAEDIKAIPKEEAIGAPAVSAVVLGVDAILKAILGVAESNARLEAVRKHAAVSKNVFMCAYAVLASPSTKKLQSDDTSDCSKSLEVASAENPSNLAQLVNAARRQHTRTAYAAFLKVQSVPLESRLVGYDSWVIATRMADEMAQFDARARIDVDGPEGLLAKLKKNYLAFVSLPSLSGQEFSDVYGSLASDASHVKDILDGISKIKGK